MRTIFCYMAFFCYLGRHCLSCQSFLPGCKPSLRHFTATTCQWLLLSYVLCYKQSIRHVDQQSLTLHGRGKRGDEKRAPHQTIHPNDTPSILPELMTHHGTGVTLCLSHTLTQQSQHIIILPTSLGLTTGHRRRRVQDERHI